MQWTAIASIVGITVAIVGIVLAAVRGFRRSETAQSHHDDLQTDFDEALAQFRDAHKRAERMKWPVPGGVVTAGFDQMRPLSLPKAKRTHKHGAIDIAAPIGSPIIAPEDGIVAAFCAFRASAQDTIETVDLVSFPFDVRGHCYCYDTYGAVTFLIGDSGITHVFAHSFMNQVFNRRIMSGLWRYEESSTVERFPVCVFFTPARLAFRVQDGEAIGFVGNAGYSTGPHVHYEMHNGTSWNDHAMRPRPSDHYDEIQV